MIDPKAVEAIKKSRAGKELIKFITDNIQLLDRVSDIELTDPMEIALETKARKKASEVLAKLLEPFLEESNDSGGFSKQDYVT